LLAWYCLELSKFNIAEGILPHTDKVVDWILAGEAELERTFWMKRISC